MLKVVAIYYKTLYNKRQTNLVAKEMLMHL